MSNDKKTIQIDENKYKEFEEMFEIATRQSIEHERKLMIEDMKRKLAYTKKIREQHKNN